MATYTLTLIPNEVSTPGYTSASGMNNALSNVTDDDYGTIKARSGGTGYCYLGFEALPSNIVIDSVSAKIRAYYEGGVSNSFQMWFNYVSPSGYINSPTGTAGSVNGIPYKTTDEITEIPINESFELNNLVGNRPVISVSTTNTKKSIRIYGASITITYHHITNKVVYDGTTLIDLTSDTVTAADVLSGVTFHLASGVQATGTASGGVTQGKISSQTSVSSSSLSFAGLQGEPISFVVYINAIQGSSWINYSGSAEYRTLFIYYDGTDRYTIAAYTDAMDPAIVRTNGSDISFTYTNGTLSFSASSAYGGKFYTSLTTVQYTLVYWY